MAVGHTCCLDDPKADIIKQIAKRGAFVGFDRATGGLVPDDKKVTMVLAFLEAGFADHIRAKASGLTSAALEACPCGLPHSGRTAGSTTREVQETQRGWRRFEATAARWALCHGVPRIPKHGTAIDSDGPLTVTADPSLPGSAAIDRASTALHTHEVHRLGTCGVRSQTQLQNELSGINERGRNRRSSCSVP